MPATPRRMAAWGRVFGETGERDFTDDLRDALNAFLDHGPSYEIHLWDLQAGMHLWRKHSMRTARATSAASISVMAAPPPTSAASMAAAMPARPR